MGSVREGPTFRILCIGGSDPRMGAGVEMDAAVCRALGFEPAVVPTLDSVQGPRGLESVRLLPVEAVVHAVVRELGEGVDAVKIGALGNERMAEALAQVLEPWADDLPIVLDPVAQASQQAVPGAVLNTAAGIAVMREQLFPLTAVITPNAAEYGTGEAYESCRAVLRKGGHDAGDVVVDRLTTLLEDPLEFQRPRLPGATAVHGTGCAFATLVACLMARCPGPELACEEAGDILHSWLAGPGLQNGRLVPPPTSRRDWPLSIFTSPNPGHNASPD
jgi:hydroxymethylpyrimidine/phosphomethylpyrimidine kinase